MLSINFIPVDEDEIIDHVTWGHILIKDAVEYSSSESAQTMYLVVAVDELLSGILGFFRSPTEKQYSFVSMYGDYGIIVARNRRQVISVYALGDQNHPILQTTPAQLRLALWLGVSELFRNYEYSDETNGCATAGSLTRQHISSTLQQWIIAFPELEPIVIRYR